MGKTGKYMFKRILFEIYEQERNIFVDNHKFYYKQAQKRLLSQFNNLEEEINEIAEQQLEDLEEFFDPDYHDPDDFLERAYENANEQLILLNEMRDQTLLSVLAGMYHQWDKALREWMAKETRHWGGKNVVYKIWKIDIGKIFDLFEVMGWKIRQENFFEKLDACRLIVNIYKHGNGDSLNELRKNYPFYFYDYEENRFEIDGWFDHTCISLTNENLKEFYESILEFWQNIPNSFFVSDEFILPKWLKDALIVDSTADKIK
ncbi:hypothetical protein KTI22_16715 [Acinetobacter baumannii]|nr:hypothetical protein [Acinetobacter baumannii]